VDDSGVLDNPFGNGITGKAGHLMNFQFVHELLAVFFHRFDADEQFTGDLFVGVAFGDQLEHFRFTRGEPLADFLDGLASNKGLPVMIVLPFGDGGAEKGVAFPRFPNGRHQILPDGLFDEIAGCAGVGQLLHILIIAIGRENDDFGPGAFLADLPSRLEPVKRGHPDVHYDDIGL